MLPDVKKLGNLQQWLGRGDLVEECVDQCIRTLRRRFVFGSWEADVTATGPRECDARDIEQAIGWQGQQDWFFGT